MAEMQMIITVDSEIVSTCQKIIEFTDFADAKIPRKLINAIANGTPVASEDMISRAFVEQIVNEEFVDLQDGTEEWRSCVNDTCQTICEKVHSAPKCEVNKISLLPMVYNTLDEAFQGGHDKGYAAGFLKGISSGRAEAIWQHRNVYNSRAQCSECGWWSEVSHYCCNCGAKMTLGEIEDEK